MNTTRRFVLGALAAGSALSALRPRQARAQGYSPAQFSRRDVNTLDSDDPILDTYRTAIAAMQALPDSDPLSWQAQAEIHLNFCPHGNWFFLPWHRAYLDQFERIIRHLGNDPDWALPYWDWTRNPQIPAPFWEAGSPLDHPRNIGPNTSMPAEFVGEPAIRDVMEKEDFEDFASFKSTLPRGGTGGGSADLERRPHNSVHRTIGADMASFLSPRDPIFWLHHCNIDRIWASWNAVGNANTADPDLADFTFEAVPGQFVTPDGTPKAYTVRDIYTTQALQYGYDRLEPGPDNAGNLTLSLRLQRSQQEVVRSDLTRSVSAGGILDSTVSLPGAAERVADTGRIRALSLDTNANFAAPSQISTARLALRGLKAPAGPDTAVRVFINCDYLSVDTPLNDPHFVGVAAFFVTGVGESDHAGHGADFVFDLTEALDALRRRGTPINGEIRPQVLAVDSAGKGTEIAIDGGFEITVETLG